MGTWGTAIFSDDLASDVRGDFRDLIGDGHSPEEATDHLLAEYTPSIDDPDDCPFWLGLAVTQWKCGRLQESVKGRALLIIDSGLDLQRWTEDASLTKARRAVLAKTRALLLSPQPAAKRIPMRFREANEWERGELISYRTVSGRYVVLRVLSHSIDKGGKRPNMEFLDYYDEAAPTFDLARTLPARPTISQGDFNYNVDAPFCVMASSKRELPKDRLVRLGVRAPVKRPWTSVRVLWWREFDAYIEKRLVHSITWQPGPGGDDHERWEVGDVLAHRTASGTYLIFHVIGRYRGYGIDGAPVVAHLNWQDRHLPSAQHVGSGALVPCLASKVDQEFAYVGYVFVHGDHDAVESSTAFRRIGGIPPRYDRFLESYASGARRSTTPIFDDTRERAHDLGMRLHASLPMALRHIEEKYLRAQPK